MREDNDTIVAISTAEGEGGIGMIRLSGDQATTIALSMFNGADNNKREKFTPRHVTYGYIVDETGERIDEVLLIFMKAPQTYTREDVVEISCHGGHAATRKILERATALGARLARPGEFSKRAFLNGRIDLVQAEAIIDLIRSRSDKGWKTAFSQLDGKLSDELGGIEERLVSLITTLETSIDFPDEEIEIADDFSILTELDTLDEQVKLLIESYGAGRIYRDGISIAIVGRPNVGKSSLMNALLKRDRVIVTPTPGTTRDTVEETLHVEGISVRIIDTAGVRETEDDAERFGVKRAMSAAADADIVLLLLDSSTPLTDEDDHTIKALQETKNSTEIITLLNKSDLPNKIGTFTSISGASTGQLKISAKQGDGVDELRSAIAEKIRNRGEGLGDGPVLTRERHLALLKRFNGAVNIAKETLDKNLSREFIAADLADAKEALEELTGKAVDEQVIDKIFDEFCIGK